MKPRAQRGVALILVLWLTVLLTVIAAGFAYSMRTEALAARNAVALAQMRALADGAISRVTFELMRPRTVAESWAPDGAVHYWQEDGATIAANAVDESGKIDLNAAPDVLLKNLFQTAAGVDADTAARLVDAIDDWKSPATYGGRKVRRRPNIQGSGAVVHAGERAVRDGGGAAARARHDPRAVCGGSGQPDRIQPAAGRQSRVRIADDSAGAAQCDGRGCHAYIAQRNDALAQRLPLPAFPIAGGAAPINVWRIRAEATAADGVTFVREAVIRPGGEDALHPLTVLLWQEADRRQFAPPPASQ